MIMKPKQLNSKISTLINSLITDEYHAHYQYQAASNWCQGAGFTKAAEFFKKESDDELEHARRIMQYLVDWNVTPELPVIVKPVLEFKSLIEAIEMGYQLEFDLLNKYQDITADIEEMDTAAYEFLSQFLSIQTESVANYSDMLNVLEGVDPTKFNMLLIEPLLFS